MRAEFQAGILVLLSDRVTGTILLRVDPNKLSEHQPLFGSSGIDLSSSTVSFESMPLSPMWIGWSKTSGLPAWVRGITRRGSRTSAGRIHSPPVPLRCAGGIQSDEDNPSVVRAFRRSDVVLEGDWAGLPWLPPGNRSGRINEDDQGAFHTSVSGYGILIGRMPEAGEIRMKGAYAMRDASIGPTGDAVIRMNGAEVMRVPPGPRPFAKQFFDVDVTAYAGGDVMVEFVSAGPHRTAWADWYRPRIEVRP
jgi:hypothetical protein